MSMSAGRSVFDLLAKAGPPLAEGSWYESVQHRFLFGEPELIRGLLTAALAMGLVLLVIGMSYRWQKRRQQPAPTQPMALFRRVLSKMGLTVIERWLLWRLARNSGLEHPTALLISTRLYDGRSTATARAAACFSPVPARRRALPRSAGGSSGKRTDNQVLRSSARRSSRVQYFSCEWS